MTAFLSTWVGFDSEAHLAVTVGGDVAEHVSALLPTQVEDHVASRLGAGDPTLWGPAAEADAASHLGWTALHETARRHLEPLEELFVDLRGEGVNRVVLVGMGGATLAAQVICATYGVPLVTLDSTSPDRVRAALAGDLRSTVMVVASKSGSTIETEALRAAVESAFTGAGIDPRRRMVVVTDAGSPLEAAARAKGCRGLFLEDPSVGGRFSALSAFGLVPAALAGVPVLEVLDEAAAVAESLEEDDRANPALVLGAALAGRRRFLVVSDHGSGIVGLGDWIEHLVGGATGKGGKGVVPVLAAPQAPDLGQPDAIDCRLVSLSADDDAEGPVLTVSGTLGALLLLWEHAVAVTARLLGVDPFDEPDVESSRTAARDLLESDSPGPAPAFVDDGIEAYGTLAELSAVTTVHEALQTLEECLGSDGYLAVLAYLDREANPSLPGARRALAQRLARPVTFGWGPRYLHSTGQLHKGGPASGVFLLLTADFSEDLAIPGLPFTFGRLIHAQAAGDARSLSEAGRPVLRLNLTDRTQVARVAALLEG
ncbi:glucose-6-phosphate isomerase [Demequina capsici]|uniref:glucose-6-phosphate isomerase n=1 Tax=Demequina capsici TaxID=3075620 RepID=UPI003F68A9A3